MSSGGAIRLEALEKAYGEAKAVRGIDLEIAAGEFFSLLGPSGCGKTTTLRMIAGFEQPTAGRILLDGEDLASVPAHRRPVNTVFQNYALFPFKSVHDNVAFGLRYAQTSKAETRRRVGEALELVHLSSLASRRPAQLSGGQQQRVALARALVLNPRVLLLDEPLGALDAKLRKALQVELKALQETVGITFVYVTHDQEEALTMSDRLAVMTEGRIEQVGAPTDVYTEPSSAYVADFLGAANVLDVEVLPSPNGVALSFRLCDQVLTAGSGTCMPGQGKLVARPERLFLSTMDDETPAPRPPASSGPAPAGQAPAGQAPAGSVPAGSVLAGQVPAGSVPAGSVPTGQALAGTVERRVFLGAAVHVVVRLPNDATLTVGTAAHDPASFAPGTRVTVTLPPEALRLLP